MATADNNPKKRRVEDDADENECEDEGSDSGGEYTLEENKKALMEVIENVLEDPLWTGKGGDYEEALGDGFEFDKVKMTVKFNNKHFKLRLVEVEPEKSSEEIAAELIKTGATCTFGLEPPASLPAEQSVSLDL
jgi:hypothetical protein